MNGGRNQRTLLLEIMMAVFFFALCAPVLMQTFATAHEVSCDAGAESDAVLLAEDLAERLYASRDMDARLEADGFALEGGVWRMERDGVVLEASLSEEAAEAGRITAASVRVLRDEKILMELPVARYQPKEAEE